MPARPAASTPRRGGRRGPVGGGNVGPAAPFILRPLPFVLRCLGDLFPSVFLRARHVAPSTCRGRCRTSGGSGQGAYSGLPDFACLLSPAPPAPALSPSDLFLHRRIVYPTLDRGNVNCLSPAAYLCLVDFRPHCVRSLASKEQRRCHALCVAVMGWLDVLEMLKISFDWSSRSSRFPCYIYCS